MPSVDNTLCVIRIDYRHVLKLLGEVPCDTAFTLLENGR